MNKLDSKNTTKLGKKRSAASDAAAGANPAEWFGDIKKEFKKITWTERQELKAYTKVVIGATFVMGFAIFGIDLFIKYTVEALATVFKVLVG
ncbi:MAG: preprotein translocase subunit SecE [Waddliaceae bacterium]